MTWATRSPVLVSRRGQAHRYVLPEDPQWGDLLLANLTRKADVLKLPAPTDVSLLEAGSRRTIYVEGAPRVGARARVAVTGPADTLMALADWGLGENTVSGFGWVQGR